jgi:serine/threonine-protein kinase
LAWGVPGAAVLLTAVLFVVIRKRKPEISSVVRENEETDDTPRDEPAPTGVADHPGIRVESHIARGGLCDIFLAVRPNQVRRCALKVLRPEFRSSRKLSEAIVREGEILSLLNKTYPDEMFVEIFDQDWFHDEGVAHPYLVLEYVEGSNLRSRVRREGPLSPEHALIAVATTARALARIHLQDYVHGDMSPENIIWLQGNVEKRSGKPPYRLIDFGDARPAESSKRAEEIVGKPPFLSPEQALGFQATQASDVYSLGMVLYYLCAGRPAFENTNPIEILRMHRDKEVVFPPSVPANIRHVILSMTAKLPHRRSSAAEVAEILRSLAQ